VGSSVGHKRRTRPGPGGVVCDVLSVPSWRQPRPATGWGPGDERPTEITSIARLLHSETADRSGATTVVDHFGGTHQQRGRNGDSEGLRDLED
jgi:hypothetical protein